MRVIKGRWLALRLAAVAIGLVWAQPANAVYYAPGDPVTLSDAGLVGTIKDGIPSSIADEVGYLNTLLQTTAAESPRTVGGQVYTLGTYDYAPEVPGVTTIGAFKLDRELSKDVPNPNWSLSGSGYTYVLAKYDGINAGSIVWKTDGAAFTLPEFSYSIWGDAGQYQISHWTGFSPGSEPSPAVPEPSTIIAGALLLLPFGVSALRVLRRNKA